MKPVTIPIDCPICERVTEVSVTFPVPAQTYGPPENCYPAESGELDPSECECGHEFDYLDAIEAAADWLDGREEP